MRSIIIFIVQLIVVFIVALVVLNLAKPLVERAANRRVAQVEAVRQAFYGEEEQ